MAAKQQASTEAMYTTKLVTDEIVRIEAFKIERFESLGLGRYDAIQAVEDGIDWHTVEWLMTEKHCPLAIALEIAR